MDETKTIMAMDGLAGLKLLAFKSRDELRWHHFVRHAHFIYPDENSVKGSRTLFAALLVCSKKYSGDFSAFPVKFM